jgi:hypothetical protein
MDAAYISAFAALAGTVIGGLTSFTTSWMTQHSQARTQRLASERERREALFGRFIEEAAKLYADALQNKRDDTSAMIGIYALISRIRLTSSAPVVEKAEIVARIIFDAYLAPNLYTRGSPDVVGRSKRRPAEGFQRSLPRRVTEVRKALTQMQEMPGHTRMPRLRPSRRASRNGAGRTRRWWARTAG